MLGECDISVIKFINVALRISLDKLESCPKDFNVILERARKVVFTEKLFSLTYKPALTILFSCPSTLFFRFVMEVS